MAPETGSRTRSVLGALLVLGAAVVACDPPPATAPPPVTAPPASATSSPSVPPVAVGQPPATQERAIEGFVARPCDLLAPAQVSALGLGRPEARARNAPPDGRGPVVCAAERPVAGAGPGELTDDVVILPATGADLLSDAVAVAAPPDTVVILTVQGLPAALITRPDLYQRCSLEVRTAGGQGVEVTIGRGARDDVGDSCDVARSVGEAVVSGLPRRS